MRRFFVWLKRILIADEQCAYINRNHQSVAAENLRMVKKLSVLGMSLMGGVYILTYFAPFMESLRPLYLPYLISFTVAHLIAVLFGEKSGACLAFSAYFLSFVTMAFGIELGVFYNPTNYAGFFLVFQIVIPIMFLEKPAILNIVSMAAAVVFSITAVMVKEPEIYSVDLVDCWVCYIISVITTRMILRVRLESIDARRRLYSQSLTDELTNLHNRRGFNNRMQTVRKLIFDGTCRVTIFMLDIDNFKQFNDTYGHVAGDECLCELSEFFSSLADKYSLDFCRYGGEEFAAVSTDETIDLAALGKELVEGVRELAITHEPTTRGCVTVSVGCADSVSTSVGSDIDLVNCADAALYEAKSTGRDRYVHFSEL